MLIPQTIHESPSRAPIPVLKAAIPDLEEMACSEYSNGLPSKRLNGAGIHSESDMSGLVVVESEDSGRTVLGHLMTNSLPKR